MNDITEANIWEKPNTKEGQLELEEERQILINNDLPGPVRNTWIRIKDKELQIKRELQNNNIYIQQYQLRDIKVEIINFINYTWQDLRSYNLNYNIIELFKKRLLRLYSYI